MTPKKLARPFDRRFGMGIRTSSHPEEPPRQVLTEPDVSLSTHSGSSRLIK